MRGKKAFEIATEIMFYVHSLLSTWVFECSIWIRQESICEHICLQTQLREKNMNPLPPPAFFPVFSVPSEVYQNCRLTIQRLLLSPFPYVPLSVFPDSAKSLHCISEQGRPLIKRWGTGILQPSIVEYTLVSPTNFNSTIASLQSPKRGVNNK